MYPTIPLALLMVKLHTKSKRIILISEITHKTATDIYRMKHIISDKRFREISDETRIENLTQEVGGAIVNHLNRLYEVYSNYCNIVLEFVEENNDKRRLHNPREWADGLVPRLMDDISRRNWGTESG